MEEKNPDEYHRIEAIEDSEKYKEEIAKLRKEISSDLISRYFATDGRARMHRAVYTENRDKVMKQVVCNKQQTTVLHKFFDDLAKQSVPVCDATIILIEQEKEKLHYPTAAIKNELDCITHRHELKRSRDIYAPEFDRATVQYTALALNIYTAVKAIDEQLCKRIHNARRTGTIISDSQIIEISASGKIDRDKLSELIAAKKRFENNGRKMFYIDELLKKIKN